jgi:hypothetical protein
MKLSNFLELKEMAEMEVESYFSNTNIVQSKVYCLLDVDLTNKPFVFSDLKDLDKFEYDFDFLVFDVQFRDGNGYASEVKRNVISEIKENQT